MIDVASFTSYTSNCALQHFDSPRAAESRDDTGARYGSDNINGKGNHVQS